MDNTYIKLFRKIEEWEWYRDIPTKVLFFHLLVKATYTDKKWRGNEIKKGTLITGLFKLSEETGLSVQQIRTALNKLKSTNEITIKSTSSFSIIEIQNWGIYQDQITNQITNEQQTSNNYTRKKEIKNIDTIPTQKNSFFEEELEKVSDSQLSNSLREWWEYKKGKYSAVGWKKQISIVLKYPAQLVCDRIDEAIASNWQGLNLNTMRKDGKIVETPQPVKRVLVTTLYDQS